MTSSGVPVGDTTLLAKLREQGVHTWERRIMGDGQPSMISADVTDEVLAVIEAAQRVTEDAFVNAHTDGSVTAEVEASEWKALSAALAPFVGEATQ